MLKAVFKSWFSWDFTIYDEMTPMAQIEMAWAREAAEMKFGDATYTMSREGERIVGAIYPEHAFTRKASLDFPPTITLPVKIFFTWLALILRKREASAAAG